MNFKKEEKFLVWYSEEDYSINPLKLKYEVPMTVKEFLKFKQSKTSTTKYKILTEGIVEPLLFKEKLLIEIKKGYQYMREHRR